MTLGRLFRTVRHLRPIQFYGFARDRLIHPQARVGPAPPLRGIAPREFLTWREPSLLGPTRVRFLNEEGEIAGPEGWSDPEKPLLWLYNLHYFDDLTAVGWRERAAWQEGLIARWIAENPPGRKPGWDPYPTSLRIVNWIKWALSGGGLSEAAIHSLAAQLRWLENRLEWRLLGNHLLADLKALVVGGLFFEGPEAERWLVKGRRLLNRQLEEQILADGGHEERSPMYQAILLEDLLDLAALGETQHHAAKMLAWLQAMTHPDGQIAFFNDAAFGIAALPAQLTEYAARLGIEPATTSLEKSGYVRLESGEAVALIDLAPVGPGHQPGHAHADTLSFELSLGTERVIVNGGTSTYAPGDLRAFERSTAAASTIEVDGQSSSEMWAAFRVGRRARVHDGAVSAAEASASHDGYGHLPGSPEHRRSWRLTGQGLVVDDSIEGGFERAVARFHIHPGVRASLGADGRNGVLTTPSGRSINWSANGTARLEPFAWACEFGRREPTQSLVIPVGAEGLTTQLGW